MCPKNDDIINKFNIEFSFPNGNLIKTPKYFTRYSRTDVWLLIAENKDNKIVLGTAALQDIDIILSYGYAKTPPEVMILDFSGDKHRLSNIIVLSAASVAVIVVIVLLIKKCTSKEED